MEMKNCEDGKQGRKETDISLVLFTVSVFLKSQNL